MSRMPVEERRAQLIDAGLRIAARDGVEAVTIRGVAAEAGASLGVVHYCFADKDDLLVAMGLSMALVSSDPVRDALLAAPDIYALAHAGADGLLEGLLARRHMRLLTFEFATTGARNRALRPVAQTHLDQTWTMTYDILDRIREIAGVTYDIPLDRLARNVAAWIDGVELSWLVEQDDDAARVAFHDIADYVVSLAVKK
ncbi:regulatory protein, tetR family [Paraoerskovia marina]|uniref:Regulatory protein, tetR family n=1 Tax=Paraoerskovia marina TaxID=545619 RepID=A0A1H1Q1K9_9CELL|nr:TetR family transcriptional regulator [Paraoerskovia marina]SDS17147.1 regulatory protein, tetR family [Paraoerskovia marina]